MEKCFDAPLVDKGILQAKELGEKWDNLDKIQKVFVSPLTRTLQTAGNIFKDKATNSFSITKIWFDLIKNNQLGGHQSKLEFYHTTNLEIFNKLKDNIFTKKESGNNDNFIDVFITLDQKLVNFDFNKYSIKSYKKLDDLNKSKILDYSLELTWKKE